MTPKVAFDLLRRRFSQWSTPPNKRSNMGRTYRTEFQRFLWGAIFLSVYFLVVFYRLSGDESGSESNNGIWMLLVFGVFFCALGAYFAPAWSALAQKYTASGRRQSASRSKSHAGEGHRQSRQHRSERASASASSEHSDQAARSASADKQEDAQVKTSRSSNASQ